MGKGNDPNCRSSTTPMLVSDAEAGQTPSLADCLKPAGPEATPEELDRYLDSVEHWRNNPATREQAHQMLKDPSLAKVALYPSRRYLEAFLALYAGRPISEWQQANRHRGWEELLHEGQRTQTPYGNVVHMARAAEHTLRKRLAQGSIEDAIQEARERVMYDNNEVLEDHGIPPEIEPLIDKLGPGARSGKMEDYTRAELRKLLGFLERDCRHLSIEDLRGMALDGGLIPRYKNSPSHVSLALQQVGFFSSESRNIKRFRAAMRLPYRKLAGRWDQDRISGLQRFDQLAQQAPLLAAARSGSIEELYRAPYDALLGDPQRPAEERNRVAEGAATRQRSSLELTFGESFEDFTAALPGESKLSTIKIGSGGRRGCWGLYNPSTQEIFVNRDIAKLITEARNGKASPEQIERVTGVLAHELFHSQEGRDYGNRLAGVDNDGTAEHCMDEGGTEILGRLHAHRLAVGMGLWSDQKEDLSRHRTRNNYAVEVETVNALVAAACGELDMEGLRRGDYKQPETLSGSAREYLLELYTSHGVHGRIEELQQTLRERYSLGEEDRTVYRTLKEGKKPRYQWRKRRELDAETGVATKRYVKPDDFSHGLADMLSKALLG